MKNLKANLKFDYLYRNPGNYKQFGSIVLRNPSKLSPESATSAIQQHLIDDEFFNPNKINVPNIKVYDFGPEMDHDWDEFEKFSLTNETPTKLIDAATFLESFK
jgi:hypothetical protein